MLINEYGRRDDPTVVLLAPMMVSGEELCRLMQPYFKGSYHIIAPDQGGHGRAGAYRSADAEYDTLRSFLLEHGFTHLALVYGASLGVAVAYRLFLDPAFQIDCAWFDGVALAENAAFPEWMMKRLFRSRKKKLAKTRVEASESLVKMYGYDFAKMMTKNFCADHARGYRRNLPRLLPLRAAGADSGRTGKAASGFRRKGLRLDLFQKDRARLYAERRAGHPSGLCALRLYGGESRRIRGADGSVSQ